MKSRRYEEGLPKLANKLEGILRNAGFTSTKVHKILKGADVKIKPSEGGLGRKRGRIDP